MLAVLLIVTVLTCAQAVPDSVGYGSKNKNVEAHQFNSEMRIARDGYYSESHHVTTRDGYILQMNRIPYKRFQMVGNPFEKKPVVFLMHGLQGSAVSYITLGPRRSLAYILADAGFDVWMGNARGIINSRNHVIWNPDNPFHARKFFDYSYEDIATKDLPSMIDYILRRTRQKKLHYIGHSQGGTAFLVLNSLKPEYNDKFLSADLLAAVGYQDYFPTALIAGVAQKTDAIYNFATRIGFVEIGHRSKTEIIEDLVNSEDTNSEDYEAASAFLSSESILEALGMLKRAEALAGATLKQYAHFGQNVRDKAFRQWNYGTLENLIRYGRIEPPKYDISRITVDLTMHYTVSDIVLDERDVLNMAKDIPNAKVRRVAKDSFGHMDFVIAKDSKELVTDYIVETLVKRYL